MINIINWPTITPYYFMVFLFFLAHKLVPTDGDLSTHIPGLFAGILYSDAIEATTTPRYIVLEGDESKVIINLSHLS